MTFKFRRNGDLANDPRHAQITFSREPHGTLLGDVRDYYRDEDGTVRLRVAHFNGTPWPIDPPAGCVRVLDREAQ